MTPTPTDTPPEAQTVPDSERKGGCSAMPGSPLADALALIALGPQRSANAVEWLGVSLEMCKHCQGTENVNEAAARIMAERVKTLENALKIFKGDVDSLGHWIPDPCRRLVDYALANDEMTSPHPRKESTND